MKKMVSNIIMAVCSLLQNEENRLLAVGMVETLILAVLAVVLFTQHHPVKASVLVTGVVVETIVIGLYIRRNLVK